MEAPPCLEVKSNGEAAEDALINNSSAVERSNEDAAEAPLLNRITALERQMSTVVGMLNDELVYLKRGSNRAGPTHAQVEAGHQLTRLPEQKSTVSNDSASACFGKKPTEGTEQLPEAIDTLRNNVAVLSEQVVSIKHEHSCATGSLGSLTAQVARASVLAMQRLEKRMLQKQDNLEHKTAAQCALLAQQAKAAVEEVRARVLEVASMVSSSKGPEMASVQGASKGCDGRAMHLDAGPIEERAFGSSLLVPSLHETGIRPSQASYEESFGSFTNEDFPGDLPESLQGISASIQQAFSVLELFRSEKQELALPRQEQEALQDLADGEELVIGAQQPKKSDEPKRLLHLSEVSTTDAGLSNSKPKLGNFASTHHGLSRSASDSTGPSSQSLSRLKSGKLVANMDPTGTQDCLRGSTQNLQPPADSSAHSKAGLPGPAVAVVAPKEGSHPMATVPALAMGRSQSVDADLPDASSPSVSGASSSSTVMPQPSGPLTTITRLCSHGQSELQQLRRMHSSGAVFPQGQKLIPLRQQITSLGHSTSLQPTPRGQQHMPQAQQHQSQCQLSPRTQQAPLCVRSSASQGQQLIPQGQLISPRGQRFFSSGPQLSPHVPPRVPQFAPQGQQIPLKGQQLSPHFPPHVPQIALMQQGQESSPRALLVSPRVQSPHWSLGNAMSKAVPQVRMAVPMQPH